MARTGSMVLPDDTIDDFRQGFDFDAYFVREYVPSLPQDWSPPDAGGAKEGHA
jgi:hypothetical protein